MRVVAGYLGGRTFDSPSTHRTHPMSEKARGALFNILGDINGLSVLDAFSGSGALAIEAASRGAISITAIELDKDAFQTIISNIEKLGLRDKIEAICANVGTWSVNNQSKTFDVVLADPPYHTIHPGVLRKVASRVKSGGIVVFSLPPDVHNLLSEDEYELISNRQYGTAHLAIYRKT